MTTATVQRKDLESAVRLAAGMAHGALPILGCILVRTGPNGGAVEIVATDGTGRLELRLPAECSAGPGWAAAVSPRTLAAALRLRVTDATVALLDFEAGRLRVDLGSDCRADIPSQPPDAFPAVTAEVSLGTVSALPGELAAALQTTVSAASEDATRSALAAVHLARGADDRLQLTATDGRRVHRTWCEDHSQEDVPADGAEALLRSEDVAMVQAFLGHAAAADAEAQVWVEIAKGRYAVKASFLGGAQCLLLRQVEGLFPDAGKVIPQDKAGEFPHATVAAGLLATAVLALQRVEATDGREQEQVRLLVDVGSRRLVLDSGKAASAEAYCVTHVAAELTGYSEATPAGLLSAVVDAAFLGEWLQSAAAAGGTVELTIRGERSPISLQRTNALAVVMPMTA